MTKIVFTKNEHGNTDIAFEGAVDATGVAADKDWGTGWPRCDQDYLDVFRDFHAPPEDLSVDAYVDRLSDEERAHFKAHFEFAERLRTDGHVECEKGEWLTQFPEKAATLREMLRRRDASRAIGAVLASARAPVTRREVMESRARALAAVLDLVLNGQATIERVEAALVKFVQ